IRNPTPWTLPWTITRWRTPAVSPTTRAAFSRWRERRTHAVCRNCSPPRRRQLDRRALPDHRRNRRRNPSLLVAPPHAEGVGLCAPRNRALAPAARRGQSPHPLIAVQRVLRPGGAPADDS